LAESPKERSDIVGITGDVRNGEQGLKKAHWHVGLSMGVTGTEIANTHAMTMVSQWHKKEGVKRKRRKRLNFVCLDHLTLGVMAMAGCGRRMWVLSIC
jgi:hypothetical protein